MAVDELLATLSATRYSTHSHSNATTALPVHVTAMHRPLFEVLLTSVLCMVPGRQYGAMCGSRTMM